MHFGGGYNPITRLGGVQALRRWRHCEGGGGGIAQRPIKIRVMTETPQMKQYLDPRSPQHLSLEYLDPRNAYHTSQIVT